MALFKINRGSAANLPTIKTEGYMYITEDAGEIYVDLSADKRIKLNAEAANKIHKLTKSADGTLSEVSLSYDDLLAIHQGFTDDISAINTNLAKKMDITNPTGTGNLMVTGPATKLNIGSGNSFGTGKTYAIGDNITAMGNYSFGVGQNILADSAHVYAFGKDITSEGTYSFTTGLGTQAEGDYQVVHGKYNTPDGTSLVIIGNGTNDSNRSNAYVLDYTGSGKFAGDVYVSNGAKKLATEDAVASTKTELEGKITANTTLINGLKYAVSDSVGGNAIKANTVNITRPSSFVDAAAAVPLFTEQIFFWGSDGISVGAPVNYVIVNVKKGANGRTIADCYSLQTGAHYINGCMNSGHNASNADYNVWTGWKLQPKFDDNGHLVPSTTDAYNIGSTSLEWNNVYANNFHGNLNGTVGGFTVATNVPSDAKFTDTNTTKVTAGNGLAGGGSADSSTGVTLSVLAKANGGIVSDEAGIHLNLKQDVELVSDTNTIPVVIGAQGHLLVAETMTGATTSAAGSAGLVPSPAAGRQAAFLRGDGTWATPTDTNTTNVIAGDGLTGGGSAASGTGVTLNVGAGTGITVAADQVKAKLRSETALTIDSAAATTTSGRVYPVAVDKTGYLAVNVPWTDTDTNTHYTTKLFATSSSGTAHAATTNGNTYLRLFDDSTARQSIKITGSGATTVTSDANGVITINSTDTNTDTNYYHTRSYSTGLQISTGTGVSNMYVPYGTASQYGVVKPNAVRTSAITATNGGTTSGRYYGVEMDSNGKLFVNVPWTDTDTNTDTKVQQTATTSSTKYPVLMSYQSSPTSGSAYAARYDTSVTIGSSVLYGAAWNDYAEYRETKETIEPGRVICENGDDTLSLAVERLQPGASVVSDTFGFTIGETEKAKTPIAVSGRVLVYPYEDRYSYKPGDAVCAAPNGTVSKMTREEIREYPERIVGTVSAIPEYETWGEGNVPVNGRIWIKVR